MKSAWISAVEPELLLVRSAHSPEERIKLGIKKDVASGSGEAGLHISLPSTRKVFSLFHETPEEKHFPFHNSSAVRTMGRFERWRGKKIEERFSSPSKIQEVSAIFTCHAESGWVIYFF